MPHAAPTPHHYAAPQPYAAPMPQHYAAAPQAHHYAMPTNGGLKTDKSLGEISMNVGVVEEEGRRPTYEPTAPKRKAKSGRRSAEQNLVSPGTCSYLRQHVTVSDVVCSY